jgi:hypothetical protein
MPVENRREELIERIQRELENLNSPEDLRKEIGEWTWKSYTVFGYATRYFVYLDGVCVESFDELAELEAFTRGMICYQTFVN